MHRLIHKDFFLHANIKGFSTFIDDETPPTQTLSQPRDAEKITKS